MPKGKGIKIRPIIAIVCDEVRQEHNGKPFLIGIYANNIILKGVLPPENERNAISNLTVHLWIPFESDEIGEVFFRIRLIGPSPKQKMGIKMRAVVPEIAPRTKITPLAIGPFPLPLWESGDLKVQFRHEDEEDWQTLRIIPVVFTAEPNPEDSTVIGRPT
jgi:hypothetical protein